MKGECFKVIERPSVEGVIEIADWLLRRGYKPVSAITQIPKTGFFTQVMHWEPKHMTLKQVGRQ